MTRKNGLKRQRCLRCHPDHIYPFQKFSCTWHKAQLSLAHFGGFISFMLCILIQRHPRAPLSYWVWPPIYHLLLGLDSSECVLRNSPRSAFESLKKKKKLKVDCFRKFMSTSKCGVRHNKKSTFKDLSEPERWRWGTTQMHRIKRKNKIRKEKENQQNSL